MRGAVVIGVRIRDPKTGALRLDVNDYTVSVVHQQLLMLSGPGSVAVAGVEPERYGAFLIPAAQFGLPVVSGISDHLARNPPYMPRVVCTTGSVSWQFQRGYTSGYWLLIVVRYA